MVMFLLCMWSVVVHVVLGFSFRYRLFRGSHFLPFCFGFLGVGFHLTRTQTVLGGVHDGTEHIVQYVMFGRAFREQ